MAASGVAEADDLVPADGRPRAWLAAGLSILLALLLGLPHLLYPFGKDQGEYAYLGWAWLNGEVIYRDVFNVKPPLTHLLHALAQSLFGHQMIAIRLLDLAWQSATAGLLAAIAWRLYRRPLAALLAGAVYALTYFAADFWHAAQTDGFINLFASLAVLLYLAGLSGRRAIAWLASGLFIGLAALLKYPIGLLLPLLGIHLLLLERADGRLSDRLCAAGRPWLLIAAGFALPLLAVVVQLASSGALPEFLAIQLGYIPRYNAGFQGSEGYLSFSGRALAEALEGGGVLGWFLAIFLAELLLSGLGRPWTRRQWIVPLWGLAALAHLIVQAKYYPYHMWPLLAPQALMAAHLALNLTDIAGRLSRHARPAAARIAPLVALGLCLLPGSPYRRPDLAQAHREVWQVAAGEVALDDLYRRPQFGQLGWGVFASRANLEVADYLRAHTVSREPVFIWAFEPGIYYSAERRSVSRFIYNFPLMGRFAWPQYRDELLAELRATPPAKFLVAKGDAQPWLTGVESDSTAALANFPELAALLETGYRPAAEIGQFTIYERRP
jgi:hypothetical protein